MRKVIVILIVLAAISACVYLVVRRSDGTLPSLSSALNRSTTPNSTPADAAITLTQGSIRDVEVIATEYQFTPSEVRIKKGETVKITFKNNGRMDHNWMVDGLGGASIDTTKAGATNSITLTPSQKGTFTVFCSIGSHRALGMQGTLVVE